MSAKILAFDPNRRVPPRHYSPLAMRGRLLHMPSPTAVAPASPTPKIGFCCCALPAAEANRRQS